MPTLGTCLMLMQVGGWSGLEFPAKFKSY